MNLTQLARYIDRVRDPHAVVKLFEEFKYRCEKIRKERLTGDARFAFDSFKAELPTIFLQPTKSAGSDDFQGEQMAHLLEYLFRRMVGNTIKIVHLDNPGLYSMHGMMFGVTGWQSSSNLGPTMVCEVIMRCIGFLTVMDVRELILELEVQRTQRIENTFESSAPGV